MFLTIEQIKAARALLKWTQKDLAASAGLQDDQIHSFESGRTRSLEVLESIYKTFLSHGLDFVDGGVVRKKYEIQVLRGQQGFWDFFDDIYATIRDNGGDILVNNVDETRYVEWLGDKLRPHEERMHALSNFRQKIIIKEGDTNYVATYKTTEYRWAPEEEFASASFYLYSHKLAIIMFEEKDVSVFIIDQPQITESYKIMFMSLWNRSKIPPQK